MKKEFLVLDKSKVFLIDSDRNQLLFEGDFITPPDGYHSIIEKGKGIKKYIQKSYKINYYPYNIPPFGKLPYFFIIYEDNNEWYIFEGFNNYDDMKYPYYLKSLTHNIFPELLNVNFYENPKYTYYNNVKIDKNKLQYYIEHLNKIKITIEFVYKYNLSVKNYRLILEYDLPFYGSYIKSSKYKIENKFIILPFDITMLIKKIIADRIENNSFNTPNLLEYQYKNFNMYSLGNYYPTFVFFYTFNPDTNEYIVYEKIYSKPGSTIFIYEIKHNILQSYLDVGYDPPLRSVNRMIHIPKSDFETALNYIDKFIIDLKYSYEITSLSTIHHQIYTFPKKISYLSKINTENEIKPYYLFAKDLNYKPFILKERVLDGKYQPGGIKNLSFPEINYINLIYQIFGARIREFQIPTR